MKQREYMPVEYRWVQLLGAILELDRWEIERVYERYFERNGSVQQTGFGRVESDEGGSDEQASA